MPKPSPIKRLAGFTLVEIAIGMMIIALLLGSMLMPLSAQVESRHLSDTKKAMDEIKEALIGYAIVNGQLPCPADPTVATGSANAGVARTPPCTGANSTGVVPWTTLGVTETDGWGRRFTYRVTDYFADTIASNTWGTGCTPTNNPQYSSFALCSPGTLNILSAAGGSTLASAVPAVVISHGNNGYGAYTPQGTQLSTTGASTDELDNTDGSTNTTYVSHDITSTFDDLVTWVSPSVLFNRMVVAGKLP